jgi:cytochrome b6-f complex iron-sulfur subunit
MEPESNPAYDNQPVAPQAPAPLAPPPPPAPIAATPMVAAPAPAAEANAATEPAEAPDKPAKPGTRRRFLVWLGGLAILSTAAMVLTPIVGFLIPTRGGRGAAGGKQAVASTADVPPGGGKVVPFGSQPAIVVNTEQGVKAYSAICTHLGCVVVWNDMIAAIHCPCHDGRFSPDTGAVISGPPPGPLPPITVSVEGDQIFLTEA